MSDYLNTLVARTLRLGPVVQPRLASLFEPVSAGPTNEQVSEIFETRPPRETFPPPVRVSLEQPDLSIPKRETRTESGVTNEALNEQSGVTLQSQPVPAPLPPAPAMLPSLVTVNDTESIREVREQLSSRSADTDSITTPGETLTPSRIRPAVRITAATNDREQIQSSLVTPSLPSSFPSAAPPAPSAQSRKVNAASTPADASEGVVITIGRVDVRAVFPPPAAAPRSNRVQQKTMSLDEYLKQRSEGRR